MVNLQEKIKASIYLLSYFETLGFKNGEWEFNFGDSKINTPGSAGYVWISIMHHFFSIGGFSNIDISGWDSSDDTILMMATGLACLAGGKESDYIEQYTLVLDELKKSKRISGINTLNTLDFIKRARSIKKLESRENMGGNGAAMRTSVIGLIFYQEKDIEMLIENSILASRITHNYSIGYLGGLVTALFTSYAIRNIPVWKWIDNLLKLYESNLIDKYMESTNIYQNYLKEKDFFFEKWYYYREQRLNKFIYKPFEFLHFDNRMEDLDYYNDYQGNLKEKNYIRYGGSGLSATIIAYDSLLMSITSRSEPINLKSEVKFSLDSLLFFSTLHFGDNDTTGAISGAWYGALYGFKNFDIEKLNQLEFNKKLEILSNLVIKNLQ